MLDKSEFFRSNDRLAVPDFLIIMPNKYTFTKNHVLTIGISSLASVLDGLC